MLKHATQPCNPILDELCFGAWEVTLLPREGLHCEIWHMTTSLGHQTVDQTTRAAASSWAVCLRIACTVSSRHAGVCFCWCCDGRRRLC